MCPEMETDYCNITEGPLDNPIHTGTVTHSYLVAVEWPPSPFTVAESTLFGTMLATASGLGMLGNFMVFYLIYRFRTLRTRFSFLLISMSLSDILMSLCAQLVVISTFRRQWLYGNIGCNLYGFLSTLTVMVSIFCLVSIAIWRYLSVYSLQHRYKVYKISKRAIVINLIAIWASSFFFAVSPLIGWSRYILERNMVSCSFDYISVDWVSKSYTLSLFLFGFVLPVISMVVCYSMLTCLVCRYKRIYNQQMQPDGRDFNLGRKNKQIRKNLRTSYIGGLCILLYLASWTPYGVIAILTLFNRGQNIQPMVLTLACFTAKVVTMVNPLVYAFCHQNYRKKISLIFRRKPFHNKVFRRIDTLQRHSTV